MIKIKEKRGLSPVIATVLLIAIVIVLALIIFMWAKGFFKEKTQKFNEPIENSCQRVIFQAEVFSDGNNKGYIDAQNEGNIPIHGFELFKKENGEITGIGSVIFSQSGVEGEEIVLYGGENGRINIDYLATSIKSGDNIQLVPILIGLKGNEYQVFTCDKKYGVDITAQSI
uniref:Archaeal Type IV pilin N-terminal domain-containing protein n=1 Tax=Thermodesulfobium narugense TaxID=184064 RepID=A0A7C5PAR3_9BACT